MAMTPIVLQLPAFPPEILGKREAFSMRTGEEYEVDTAALTCSCPDFQKRRSHHPPRSVARICKHLGPALQHCGALDGLDDELIAAVVRDGRGCEDYRVGQIGPDAELVVGKKPGNPWMDVFARKHRGKDAKGHPTGPWVRYGFNLEQWRWSYGESPRGASIIKEVLASEFGRPGSGDGPTGRAKKEAADPGAGCVLTMVVLGLLLFTCA